VPYDKGLFVVAYPSENTETTEFSFDYVFGTKSSAASSSESTPMDQTLLIIIIAVAAGLLLLVLIFCCLRKKNKTGVTQESDTQMVGLNRSGFAEQTDDGGVLNEKQTYGMTTENDKNLVKKENGRRRA